MAETANKAYDNAAAARQQLGKGMVDITDPFITWLSFANAGMMHRGNVYCFDLAIGNLPSEAPIVEIGSFAGLSTNAIAYYRRKHARPNRIITSDKWLFEGAPPGAPVGDSGVTHDELRQFIKESYIRNVQFFVRGELPYTMEMLSGEFFEAWRRGDRTQDVLQRPLTLGGPISFAYIDGDHRYEAARQDFENVDAFLERGGFVFFDDSADGSGWEVCRLIEELRRDGRYEIAARNPNYMFRKK